MMSKQLHLKQKIPSTSTQPNSFRCPDFYLEMKNVEVEDEDAVVVEEVAAEVVVDVEEEDLEVVVEDEEVVLEEDVAVGLGADEEVVDLAEVVVAVEVSEVVEEVEVAGVAVSEEDVVATRANHRFHFFLLTCFDLTHLNKEISVFMLFKRNVFTFYF